MAPINRKPLKTTVPFQLLKMVMKQIVLAIFLLSVLSLPALARENDCLYYFHGVNCDDCTQTDTFITQLEDKYPELEVHRFEVHYSKENSDKLESFYAKYAVQPGNQALPTVFVGGTYFIGKESIKTLVEQRILNNKDSSCPSLENSGVIGVIGAGSPINIVETLTFSVVTGAAFQNVFNSGALAILLVFLFLLTFIKEDEHMLTKGSLFIGSVALAYIWFGWGHFSILLAPVISSLFIKAVGLIVSISALITLVDFFWSMKKLTKNVSQKTKTRLAKAWNTLGSYPSMLILGLLSGFLTVGKVNSTFMTMRNLLKGGVGKAVVFPLLVYYLILFLLLISILLVVLSLLRERVREKVLRHVPMSDMKRDAWNKHIVRVFNFSLSVVLLVLGLVALFS